MKTLFAPILSVLIAGSSCNVNPPLKTGAGKRAETLPGITLPEGFSIAPFAKKRKKMCGP